MTQFTIKIYFYSITYYFEENKVIFCTINFGEKQNNFIEQIYNRNASKMYHIALRILKNVDNAEDAVAEAFFSIAKNIDRYDNLSEKEIDSLCSIIVKNKCIDQIRVNSHFAELEIEELVFSPQIQEISTETKFLEQQMESEIRKTVQELPEIYREVIALRYYFGFGVKKIANLLGVPVKTVDNRLYRAKKIMREVLENEDI